MQDEILGSVFIECVLISHIKLPTSHFAVCKKGVETHMTTLFSYLITMFAGMFWVFRVVVALMYTMSVDIGIEPLNFNVEVILLFVTLFCMIFIIKRNIIGALVYFVTYGFYFGTDFYNGIMKIVNEEAVGLDYLGLIISFVGILLPTLTVIDIFVNKDRRGSGKDKKTDWFYTNEEYTRKLDERADKNQYKF